jgi:SAM-dependent methyltransferase
LRELTTFRRAPRIPEPDLVMDDAARVAAYTRAGREDGVMAPVYLFNTRHACDVIRPGDVVLDLACGPATQLAQIARYNPASTFIGIDLSEPMLERAAAYLHDQGLVNVRLQRSSIADLSAFGSESVDAVVSTLALHHLPDVDHLMSTMREIVRVLRPGGGIYLADFGHLKSERTIHYFAQQYADRQSDLFTEDYRNSLHAAFPLEVLDSAAAILGERARLYTTFLAPYMVAMKSAVRRLDPIDPRWAAALAALPQHHRTDFADLSAFFARGGLRTRLSN